MGILIDKFKDSELSFWQKIAEIASTQPEDIVYGCEKRKGEDAFRGVLYEKKGMEIIFPTSPIYKTGNDAVEALVKIIKNC